MKPNCIKCKTYDQIFTCFECQELFCNEHITGHREELSDKMNNIDNTYQHFKQNLNEHDIIQPYLFRIDLWEHESIDKIRKTAELARKDLFQVFDHMKNQLEASCDRVTNAIQLSHKC